MRKYWIVIGVLMLFIQGMAEEIPMEKFVAMARRSNQEATYAKLYGTLQHRRKDKPTLTIPVYFGTIIHPDRTLGQLILDGKEGYILSQAQGSGLTSIKPIADSAREDRLGYVGVRASDLVMSFLFCKVEKELDGELLRNMIPCRVFLLDDSENREKVKVWISSEHVFPLKAEFYRYGENKRFRSLEAGALTKKNDLYYVRRLRLEGPGWITRIDFDAERAEVNKLGSSTPNIMLPLKK
ncbi:MAG: hypothetical protein E7057_00550 [Lentisphaerae bacterium]|nr:hypothetical protein [Lentisphaerota bacterium]